MDLSTARKHIATSFERMRALYSRPVFDEWVIVTAAAQRGILAYVGPRVEEFRKNLAGDAEPLLAQVGGQKLEVGDFEFTIDGDGTRHDALIRLGASSYLVCNNLAHSMADLRRDQRWLKAQGAFVDLSEQFRADPLEA